MTLFAAIDEPSWPPSHVSVSGGSRHFKGRWATCPCSAGVWHLLRHCHTHYGLHKALKSNNQSTIHEQTNKKWKDEWISQWFMEWMNQTNNKL